MKQVERSSWKWDWKQSPIGVQELDYCRHSTVWKRKGKCKLIHGEFNSVIGDWLDSVSKWQMTTWWAEENKLFSLKFRPEAQTEWCNITVLLLSTTICCESHVSRDTEQWSITKSLHLWRDWICWLVATGTPASERGFLHYLESSDSIDNLTVTPWCFIIKHVLHDVIIKFMITRTRTTVLGLLRAVRLLFWRRTSSVIWNWSFLMKSLVFIPGKHYSNSVPSFNCSLVSENGKSWLPIMGVADTLVCWGRWRSFPLKNHVEWRILDPDNCFNIDSSLFDLPLLYCSEPNSK